MLLVRWPLTLSKLVRSLFCQSFPSWKQFPWIYTSEPFHSYSVAQLHMTQLNVSFDAAWLPMSQTITTQRNLIVSPFIINRRDSKSVYTNSLAHFPLSWSWGCFRYPELSSQSSAPFAWSQLLCYSNFTRHVYVEQSGRISVLICTTTTKLWKSALRRLQSCYICSLFFHHPPLQR